MSSFKINVLTAYERREIETEIELSKLMIKDLERLWKSYAKKALVAKQERELRQDKKGFLEYESYVIAAAAVLAFIRIPFHLSSPGR